MAAAARILGVRRATLSDLVNGNASLSPEMALRVEKALGLSRNIFQFFHSGLHLVHI